MLIITMSVPDHRKRNPFAKWKTAVKIFCILTVVGISPYYLTPIFKFDKGVPFSGDQFYNPYKYLDTLWMRANFHAHSRAWGGLAHGNVPVSDMIREYLDLNYHVPGISNYNFIEPRVESVDYYIPEYEHGFNVGYVHQLVLNTGRSTVFDFPLIQWLSHKQTVINWLKTADNLIVLAHPDFKNSYSLNDLEFLGGYDLMEIVSVRAVSLKHWDRALSTGHAIWGIANDDAHDTTDFDLGVCWNLVNVPYESSESCIESLGNGRTVAVKGWLAQDMNQLRELNIHNNVFEIKLDQRADSILLFSDDGILVASATNTEILSYSIQPHNTYLRAEVFETEPWNEWTRMYLNPVIRISGMQWPANIQKTKVNWILSVLYWLSIAFLQILMIYLAFFRWR